MREGTKYEVPLKSGQLHENSSAACVVLDFPIKTCKQ